MGMKAVLSSGVFVAVFTLLLGAQSATAAMVSACDRQESIVRLLEFYAAKPCRKIKEEDLAAIENMSLSYQNIQVLHAADFDGLSNLRVLDLSANSLQHLYRDLFRHLPSLRILKLNWNGHALYLPQGLFDYVPKLEELYLNFNIVLNIESGIFDPLKELRELHISTHQESLPPELFSGLTNLERLQVDSSKWRGNEGGNFPLPYLRYLHPDILRGLNRLRIVSFLGDMEDIPGDLLRDQTNLESFTLHGNLTSVPSELFRNTRSLRNLTLQAKFHTLPADLFLGLADLRSVFLGWGELEDLPPGIFRDNTAVSRLNLSRSSIVDLPVGIFDGFADVQTIDLRSNPLSPATRNRLQKKFGDRVRFQ